MNHAQPHSHAPHMLLADGSWNHQLGCRWRDRTVLLAFSDRYAPSWRLEGAEQVAALHGLHDETLLTGQRTCRHFRPVSGPGVHQILRSSFLASPRPAMASVCRARFRSHEVAAAKTRWDMSTQPALPTIQTCRPLPSFVLSGRNDSSQAFNDTRFQKSALCAPSSC